MGRKPVDSNELFFENFEIPVEDRLGEEGRGFEYILHGMNPERILIAASVIPSPDPPYSSGIQMPSQPASASARWKSAG